MNVKIRDIELHNIVRLDAKHQDRTPQPLLVSLPSVDKKMITRNAFRLKNNHDHIYISHDITNEEREVNMELLQEAVQSSRSSMGKKIVEIPVQVTA